MEKIAKSRSKNKSKGIVPQLYLRANKKEAIELKPNKIPKKKLKFNESNRRFGNDITNSIKNNAQFNGFRSFHKKCSSVSNKVNIVGNKNKINGENDNDSTLKKGNSIGRNPPNNNVEKTFSDDNLYHKKKINESNSNDNANNNNINNNKNSGISTGLNSSNGHKLKNTLSSMGSRITNNNTSNNGVSSPKNKEKLIRISEYKIDVIPQNKNETKYSLNNSKDVINRLKNQASLLKSSITNKNNINNKNKTMNHFQFDNKENLITNKHIQNEISHSHITKGIVLGKHDTFEIDQKKYFYADKNKFNKNTYFFNEKYNNSNNLSKNKNNKENDLVYKIKNLKTFHPGKYNNNKSIKKIKENNDINTNNKNKAESNKKNKDIIQNEHEHKHDNECEKNNNNKSKDKIYNKEKNEEKINKKEKEKEKEKESQIHKEIKKEKSKEKIKEKVKDKDKEEKENIKIKENEQIKNEEKENKEPEDNKENKTISDKKEKEKDIFIKKDSEKENNILHKSEKYPSDNNTKKNNNKHLTSNESYKFNTSQELVIYFDTTHINNVQIPKDYLNIIYYNLLVEENIELNPKPVHTYMKKQKEINDQMRSILVDWIIDVHHKFGFTDETLFMTILIIDRYCSSEQISRIKYQCLGITALMIACKHEEINVPKVEDFIYITDNAYTKEEVFKMENDVLSKLNFELLYPSPIKFYEYLSLHFDFSPKYHMLGKYLMETFLLDLKYVKYKPSIISCACTYIVMKFFKMNNYRQSYDKKFYLLDENVNTIPVGYGVKDCAQDICIYVDNINNTNLLSCQKKYTKTEFQSVATLISNNKT